VQVFASDIMMLVEDRRSTRSLDERIRLALLGNSSHANASLPHVLFPDVFTDPTPAPGMDAEEAKEFENVVWETPQASEAEWEKMQVAMAASEALSILDEPADVPTGLAMDDDDDGGEWT
jgi:hypothetical protein